MNCPRCKSENTEPLKSKLVYGFRCKDCDFLFDPAAYKKETTMKTTGKISSKPYQCKTCGYETSHATNHWGEFYNTHCMGCGTYTTWRCMEDPPEGYIKPEPWKEVKIGDVVTLVKGVKIK